MTLALQRILQAIVTPVANAFAIFSMSGTRVGRKIDRRVEEVRGILADYIEADCRRVVWFGFVSTAIEDAALERIRQRATELNYPPMQGDVEIARELLAEVDKD